MTDVERYLNLDYNLTRNWKIILKTRI